jgi:hypothetical protein
MAQKEAETCRWINYLLIIFLYNKWWVRLKTYICIYTFFRFSFLSMFICTLWCYVRVHYGDLILRELDYIVIISFGYVMCVCVFMGGWVCVCVYGWVGVCVCVCVCMGVCMVGWVGFVMCGCLDNVHSLNLFGYPDWGFSVLFPQL